MAAGGAELGADEEAWAFKVRYEPWLVCPPDKTQAWAEARTQAELLAPRLEKAAAIVARYDQTHTGLAQTRTLLKKALQEAEMSYDRTVDTKVVAPSPLNRPVERSRMRDVVCLVRKNGFDEDTCSGAMVVEDVPGTEETTLP